MVRPSDKLSAVREREILQYGAIFIRRFIIYMGCTNESSLKNPLHWTVNSKTWCEYGSFFQSQMNCMLKGHIENILCCMFLCSTLYAKLS